jgi:hypothetical protein
MAATGPTNPVLLALATLDSADLELEHCSALQEVSDSLATITQAIREHNPSVSPRMRIYSKVVYYDNANSRTSHFNQYLERNLAIQSKFTFEEWNEEVAAYGISSDAVSQAVQNKFFVMMGTIQNPVFSHSFFAKVYKADTLEARHLHYSRVGF